MRDWLDQVGLWACLWGIVVMDGGGEEGEIQHAFLGLGHELCKSRERELNCKHTWLLSLSLPPTFVMNISISFAFTSVHHMDAVSMKSRRRYCLGLELQTVELPVGC